MTRVPSYDSVADLFKILIEFHQQLANIYGRLQATVDNKYSKLLAEEMQRRELRLVETLDSYEENAPKHLLDTMLQKSFPDDPNKFLSDLEGELTPDAAAKLSPEDVYGLASRADDYIAELLSLLKDVSNVPDVRALFEDLRAGEELERIALSKAYNSLREM